VRVRRRRHRVKQRRAVRADLVHAVDHELVKVDVEVDRGSKTLDGGDATGLTSRVSDALGRAAVASARRRPPAALDGPAAAKGVASGRCGKPRWSRACWRWFSTASRSW